MLMRGIVILALLLPTISWAACDINISSLPYTTTTAGTSVASPKTYCLTGDLAADGNGIYVNKQFVVIDLQGHTLTYDNAAPIPITNGSFQSGDATGWDLSSAPDASVYQGDHMQLTAFTSPSSPDSYSLKIGNGNNTNPVSADNTVTTTGTYVLKAGVKYSASAMAWEPYHTGLTGNSNIRMTIAIIRASDSAVLAYQTYPESIGANYQTTYPTPYPGNYSTRGFQYIFNQYTPVVDETVKIQLKLTGATGTLTASGGNVPYGAFYFDDVRIQQSQNNGVRFGTTSYAGSPLPLNTLARQGRVTNGKIVQGQAHGDFAHAVSMIGILSNDLNSYKVDNLEITVSGNSSHGIKIANPGNGIVTANTIHSYVNTILNRDHYWGAVINADNRNSLGADPARLADEYSYNTITHGPQTGIFSGGSVDVDHLVNIHHNDITLQSRYTNDFGIVSYDSKADVGQPAFTAYTHDNIIRCDPMANGGSNTCRGLFQHGNYGKIQDNTVDVHYNANSQEYALNLGGCAGAAYGIQIDILSSNLEVSGNTVTAYGEQCDAAAFRHYSQPVSGTGSSVNVYVHNNQFKSVNLNNSNVVASAVRIIESYAATLNFSNNLLITNQTFLDVDGNVVEPPASDRSLTLDGNRLQLIGTKTTHYAPLIDRAYPGCNYGVPKNVSLTNNTYLDGDYTAVVLRSDMTGTFKNAKSSFATDVCSDSTGSLSVTEYSGGADVTPPVTSALIPAGTYNAALSVSLICTDDSGTCASTYYCLGVGCTPSTPYSASISVTSSNTLRFYSTDVVPNTETTKSVAYVIDTTAPTITAFTVTSASKRHTIPVTLTATDGGSGVAAYCIQPVNVSTDCNWLPSITSYTPTTSGATTLYGFAKDTVDNISDPSSGVAVTFTSGGCR